MLDLVNRIYASADDASLWPATLEAIAIAVRCESIALFAGFPDFKMPDLYARANFPTGSWEAFCSYYATINPIMERCAALFEPEKPWLSHLAVPDVALEATEFYNDFFKPFDMHYSLGIRMDFQSHSAALSCQRPKEMGAFSNVESLVLQTLVPHLKRALKLHGTLRTLETKANGFQTALEAYDHALVGVDGQGKVCLINPLALELVASGDGLYLAQERLRCVRADEDAALQRMLVWKGGDKSRHAVGDSLLVSRENRVALHVTLLPLQKILRGRSSPLAALLLISDPQYASSRAAILKRLYGVTPSEARVADLLLQGLDIREISSKQVMTLETTRFQVKQLLAKTGARRQAELLRLLSLLPGASRQKCV